MDWLAYFTDALRLVSKKISKKERVVVYAPQYLANLTDIIKEYNNSTEGKM